MQSNNNSNNNEKIPKRQKEFSGPEIKRQDIEFIEIIGGGAYGNVWKALVYGHLTAVKELNEKHASEIENLRKEAEIMSQANHPNVCMFLGACIEENEFLMVTELCEKSLEAIIKHSSYKSVPYLERLEIIKQVSEGMSWLHKTDIVHCDLKPANVLFGDGVYKVTDFGFAQLQSKNEDTKYTNTGGSPLYMAPERLSKSQTFSKKTDVYSFAILSWEVLTGLKPFPKHNNRAIFSEAVNKGERPSPQLDDKQMQEILEKSWAHDPEKRPNFQRLTELLTQAKILNAVNDEKGRNFWTNTVCESGIVLQTVDWAKFREDFFSKFSSLANSKAVETKLKKMLCGTTNIVSVTRFGLLCDTFDIMNQNSLEMLPQLDSKSNSWFFEDVDEGDATESLKSKTSGTFLVRFSGVENKFVISRVISNGQVIHTRIAKTGGKFHLPGSQEKYDNIFELVSGEKQAGRLRMGFGKGAGTLKRGQKGRIGYRTHPLENSGIHLGTFSLSEELAPLMAGSSPVDVYNRLEKLRVDYLNEMKTENYLFANEDKVFWLGQIIKYSNVLDHHIKGHPESSRSCAICGLVNSTIQVDELA